MILLFSLHNVVVIVEIIAIIIIGCVAIGSLLFVYFMKYRKAKAIVEAEVDYSGLERKDTLDYVKFEDVRDDMIIMNGGCRFVGAIITHGCDFPSLPVQEKLSVKNGYISFLGTLKDPISKRQTSKAVDLSYQIKKYENRVSEVETLLVSYTMDYDEMRMESSKAKEQGDYTSLELLLDEMEKKSRSIEVLNARINHLQDQIEYMNIVSNGAFTLDSEQVYLFDWTYIKEVGSPDLTDEQIEKRAAAQLKDKANAYISALLNANVRARRCTTAELEIMAKRHFHPLTGATIKYSTYVNSNDFVDITSAPEKDNIYKDAVDDLIDNIQIDMAREILANSSENNEQEQNATEPVEKEETVHIENIVKEQDKFVNDPPDREKSKSINILDIDSEPVRASYSTAKAMQPENKQPVNKQPGNEQSLNKQSVSKQALNKQPENNQLVNNQPVKKQVLEKLSMLETDLDDGFLSVDSVSVVQPRKHKKHKQHKNITNEFGGVNIEKESKVQ